jgi:hypothetical protein
LKNPADALDSSQKDPFKRSKEKQKLPDDTIIIGGSSNKELSENIAKNLGTTLAKTDLKKFADGECAIEIQETVANKRVYII